MLLDGKTSGIYYVTGGLYFSRELFVPSSVFALVLLKFAKNSKEGADEDALQRSSWKSKERSRSEDTCAGHHSTAPKANSTVLIFQ